MQPLVSVIIPTFGDGNTLLQTIQSALDQSYKNIEVVVVDDNGRNSYNHSKIESIMQRFIGKANVKYIVHEHNINGAAARNTGVKASSGEYIALLDDDDVYYPYNIEKQLKILRNLNSNYAMTCCLQESYLNGRLIERQKKLPQNINLYGVLMHKYTIASSSMLIRKKVWEEIDGFDETFKRHQDWEFVARVVSKYKIMPVDYVGFRYNMLFRNSPPNVLTSEKYRLHYLKAMEPLMNELTTSQKKDVVVYNQLAVAIDWIKVKNYRMFVEKCIFIRPGYRLFLFLMHRILIILKRKRLRVKL